MIKNNPGEKWKVVDFPNAYKVTKHYAVSNHGRFVSFYKDIRHGKLIMNFNKHGYNCHYYRSLVNNVVMLKRLAIHFLVAENFIPGKPENEKALVLHKDHNPSNNHVDNLMWATQKELTQHHQKNPSILALRKRQAEALELRKAEMLAKRKPKPICKFYPGEEWKEMSFPQKLRLRYAVSSYGRVMSFTEKLETGYLLMPVYLEGYSVFRFKEFRDGKIITHNHFVRKLVAQQFLPPPKPEQTFVILLDRNRKNCRVENLKWATRNEMIEHYKKSPYFIQARFNKKRSGIGKKLTSTQVQLIKQKLADSNRKTRLKMIAKQFGITTMTLQRIKTGENWKHVKLQRKAGQKYVEENNFNIDGLR